ncbi:bidirectional sugar transporter SWEET2b-like [Lolium perenne]|uniref:bidirectional sugar transporter SWEET2b-like n=1 Tax=Lolium perenne TaxID=4522 RepID=UPI0021F53F58|nr:bidirectional sugar transporter SWEET5-like [Lolium perenne]
MGTLRNVAGGFGAAFAALLILAPVKTMKDIKRDNSVGDRWVLNYVATYANAVCMVAYTMPTKQYFLAIINAVAVFAEFGYSCFYRHYAEGRAKTIATWAILGELLWGAIVLAAYFSAFFGGRREDLRVKLFGTLGAVTSGAMYLAMIPDTWAVFTTHNIQNQNILLLLTALANCTAWTVYAIKPRDLFIQYPNGGGIALSAIQTMVWVAVWLNNRNAAPAQQPLQNQPAAPQENQPAAPQQNRNEQVIELPVVLP